MVDSLIFITLLLEESCDDLPCLAELETISGLTTPNVGIGIEGRAYFLALREG